MFTVGCDPEFFATDGKAVVSVIGKIPGVKGKPCRMSFGAIHVDNVACEFNTLPAVDADSFSQSVSAPIDYLENLLKVQGLLVSKESYAEFSAEDLLDPAACEAGCEPDFNAYTGEINCPPDLYSTKARSAAGHVHVGTALNEYEIPLLVKALDLFMTIPALHLENPQRRVLYGKAGCFRPKPYGLEYRTPSNHWVWAENRRKWIFNTVELAFNNFRTVSLPNNLERVINEHDTHEAALMSKHFGLAVCPN